MSKKNKQPDTKPEITAEAMHLGALAHGEFRKGINPPSMVEDEDIWEKAKSHILKSTDMDEDKFWPEVMAHYQELGGGIKAAAKATDSAATDTVRGVWSDSAREAAALARKNAGTGRFNEADRDALSTGAKKASDSAWGQGPKAHGEAADAHHVAAEAFGKQAEYFGKDHPAYYRHANAASYHEGQEKIHRDQAVKATGSIKAADNEVTGKPSIQSLISKVTDAIQEDPRFDTDSHGQPEGSPGDVEPWCCDILTPNDDGSLCAVIRKDDGTWVKHHFFLDDGEVDLLDGDSEPTEATTIWAAKAKEHDDAVKAGGPGSGRKPGFGSGQTGYKPLAFGEHHKDTAMTMADEKWADHDDGEKLPRITHEEAMDAAVEGHWDEISGHAYKLHGYSEGDADKLTEDQTNKVTKTSFRVARDLAKNIREHGNRAIEDWNKASKASRTHEYHNSNVIHCRSSGVPLPASDELPTRFMWMPGGVSTIEATWNDKPIQLTVECDEQTAPRVQASLDAWQKKFPHQKPFGCIEHREQEAAIWPKTLAWSDEPEPGVFCTGDWSELGARNVKGRIHRSWSPSFTTDAEYNKATERGGVMTFPKGARGGKDNPAKITGVAFSIGSLTNKPAFKNIMPVKASAAAIKAGGPGSGRKPEGYASGQKGSHAEGTVHKFHLKDVSSHEFGDEAELAENHHGGSATITGVAVAPDEESKPEHGYYDIKFPNGDKMHAVSGYHLTPHTGGGSMKASGWYGRYKVSGSKPGQAEPQPASKHNAEKPKGLKMKLKFIKARGEYAAGTVAELADDEALAAMSDGSAIQASAAEELEQLRTERKTTRQNVIKAKIAKAKERGAIAPKDEEVQAATFKRLDALGWQQEAVDLQSEVIDGMAGTQQQKLTGRYTAAVRENALGELQPILGADHSVLGYGAVTPSLDDVCLNGYCKAREPMDKMIREGGKEGIIKAMHLSAETSALLRARIDPIVRANGEYVIRDLVRAADVTDTNVGTIATGLILQRNLGYLKNKLGWLPYISTDLRAEPALFNQPVFTRYITPPAAVAYNTSTGWADSTPSTTDVTVTMSQHYGVQITFQTQLLGSTTRALFAEQQGAQFYALAEKVNSYFLTTIFGATWTDFNSKTSTLSVPFNTWNLTGAVKIKNTMTLKKIPDVGRFVLLHSSWYDALLTDTNLLTAKAILSLINKDASAFESSSLPMLFGLKIEESQLAAATTGVLTTISDPTQLGGVNQIGFAGNMASALFVARIPQDYTKVLPDIPSTAAIEIATEPDSGLSVMFVKYLNHQLANVTARCALMYGAAQGDPRQGIILTP